MKEINQSLYIHYAKILIFLKDFIKHITYLSQHVVHNSRDLELLESDFFFMVATAFIYTVWYVYKCNCINSSSKKKILKFNGNGGAIPRLVQEQDIILPAGVLT